jgi:hypothetical protein
VGNSDPSTILRCCYIGALRWRNSCTLFDRSCTRNGKVRRNNNRHRISTRARGPWRSSWTWRHCGDCDPSSSAAILITIAAGDTKQMSHRVGKWNDAKCDSCCTCYDPPCGTGTPNHLRNAWDRPSKNPYLSLGISYNVTFGIGCTIGRSIDWTRDEHHGPCIRIFPSWVSVRLYQKGRQQQGLPSGQERSLMVATHNRFSLREFVMETVKLMIGEVGEVERRRCRGSHELIRSCSPRPVGQRH